MLEREDAMCVDAMRGDVTREKGKQEGGRLAKRWFLSERGRSRIG